MDIFEKIFAGNLHHAYLLVGGGFADVDETLKNQGTIAPEIRKTVCDTLNIDLARDIAESSGRKSFSGGKKFFLISANIITEEAQNSMLKIFEEPAPDTHFFVFLPQDTLLPTLRSRMQVIKLSSYQVESQENILKKPLAERLALVKEITDGISDEEKTKQDAIILLNRIEDEIYQNSVEKAANNLALCQKTRAALYDRGAPVKMILENLMICLD